MPIARRYSLSQVLETLQSYQQQTRRRITIEYCLIKGFNDSPAQARQLLLRLKGLQVHVNLIEFNDFPGCPYDASEQETLERFARELQAGGLETVIRFKRGRSIKAACGQLGADRLGSRH